MKKRYPQSFMHGAIVLIALVISIGFNTEYVIAQNQIAAEDEVVWPLRDSHNLWTGFGAGLPDNPFLFHEGIDILASDQENGDTVFAARSGTIDLNYQGRVISIKVKCGGRFEYDDYVHIQSSPEVPRELTEGQFIEKGTPIGKISTLPGDPEKWFRHLHFGVRNASWPRDSSGMPVRKPPQNQFLNPLERFTKPEDRDPQLKEPGLKNTDNVRSDNLTWLLVSSGGGVFGGLAGLPPNKNNIRDDVDIVADIVDQTVDDEKSKSTNYGFATTPYKIGYYIKALFEGSHDVKSATRPYVLAKFDDNWFTTGTPDKPTISKFYQVYDNSRPINIIGTEKQYNNLNNLIVTNTKGEDGSITNVDENQYWRTKALNDRADNTVEWANYADRATARTNAEARFPDGDYEIHFILADLVHTIDKTDGFPWVRLNNFPQTCETAVVDKPEEMIENKEQRVETPKSLILKGIKQPVYTYLRSPEEIKWQQHPAGKMIGVKGEGYYRNQLMNAYLLKHKDKRTDGEPFDDMKAIPVVIKSDENGVVNLTPAWKIPECPEPEGYDVVIDYDNNKAFSMTLDGLSSFKVIG